MTDNLLAQRLGTLGCEMNVGRSLYFLQPGFAKPVQVIDRDAFFFHDLCRDGVIFRGVADDPTLGAIRHRCRAAPDECGPGLFQLSDQPAQVLFILLGWNLLMAARSLRIGQVLSLGSQVFQVVQA